MASLDDVLERIREASTADFAFVLSRRGKLVTREAPKDMPEAGRGKIVIAARSLAGTNNVGMLTLPRQELVPFGGAAPIDVYIAVADDGAILAVVMATWTDRKTVLAAIQGGLASIGERSSGTNRRNTAANAKRIPKAAAKEGKQQLNEERKTPTPASKRHPTGPMMGLLAMARAMGNAPTLPAVPVIRDTLPDPIEKTMGISRGSVARVDSSPEITIGAAALGRESLERIENEIPIGYSRGESVPEITVESGTLGRESMIALEEDARRLYAGSMPDLKVEVVPISRASEEEIERAEMLPSPSVDPRMTQPWVEAPVHSKRAADAARSARAEPPKLSLKLEEADDDVIAALDRETPPPNPR